MATDAANEIELLHAVDPEAPAVDALAALIEFAALWLEEEEAASASKPR